MSNAWKRLNQAKPISISKNRSRPYSKKMSWADIAKRLEPAALLSSFHQRWLDTSLRRKGWAVVMLPTVALVVSFVGLVAVVLTSRSVLDGVQADLKAQSSAQSVLSSTLGAETGVRAYLATRDSSYLIPLQTAQKNLPSALASLSTSLVGDKSSQSLLSELKTAVNSDLGLLSSLENVNTFSGIPETTLLTQENGEIAQVRSLVDSIDGRIATIVASKEATAHDIADSGLWVALAALILGLSGGLAATQLFTSGISIRIRSLQRSAERLSRGEPPERLPFARDEVGKLAEALSQASNLLDARELALREESIFFEHLVSASPVVKFQSHDGLPGNGFVSENLDRVFSLPARLIAIDGDNWISAIHRDDRGTVISQAQQALADRRPQLISTYRVLGRDGVQRWVYSTVKLSYEDEAGMVSALGVLIDITESKEATRVLGEREEMLRALFDALPDAVMVIDKSGRIKMVSKTFTKLTGEPLSGSDALNFFHYLDPRELVDTEEQIGSSLSQLGTTFMRRMRLRGAKGWRVIEGHGVALDFHKPDKDLLVVLRDVTERVELEEKLTEATAAAEAANRAKSDFLSRMSHELRTPLNAILGFTELLELDQLGPQQQDSLDQIRRGGQHLLQLIDEVLDIARIETGKISISKEKVALPEVVNEVCNLLRPLAVVRGIEISTVQEPEEGRLVLVDRQRLRQILLNLLSNAIKYNRQNGSVMISYELDRKENIVSLSVADTGPGISPEQIDLVFAPFERLGAETSNIEGTGIGLTLSRELAEAMESSLTVESSSTGTTFHLKMPYAGDHVDEVEDIGAGESEIPLKVLYIEDDPSNVKLIERALNRLDYISLAVANFGRQAIDTAFKDPPHVIMLDLHLPDIAGEVVLSKIRSDTRTHDIPVYVMSADATEMTIKRTLDAGATDYLTKPVAIERVYEILERLHSVGSAIRSRRGS